MNNTDGKTLIADFLSIEELRKRKIFFIMDCMLLPENGGLEIFKVLKQFTDETGIKFSIEHNKGFKVFKKIE